VVLRLRRSTPPEIASSSGRTAVVMVCWTSNSRSAPNLFQEVNRMNIEIRDPSLEARLKKQIETTESGSVEEVLEILLETKEQQDLWLQLNREAINADIKLGLEQLERGEGIPDDQLDTYLAKMKKKL
jgi:hypothetical protein